jgi:phytoene dehydrogenase-like protein
VGFPQIGRGVRKRPAAGLHDEFRWGCDRRRSQWLYLCGSSSGSGGGVNAPPGYIAAKAIADDLALKRSWTPVPPPEWRH